MIPAEWVKFRSVRGWVLAVVVAVVAIVGFGLAGGNQGSCYGNSCAQLTGPGGEAVSDSFYFVHQALAGNGAITVRVTSLTSAVQVPHGGTQRAVVPWAKAGIIVKASLARGFRLRGDHGHRQPRGPDAGRLHRGRGRPGHAGGVAAARTVVGSVITGYASADGTRWTRVGAVTLPGLPTTVQGGLFTTSPQWTQTSLGVAAITGDASQSTAVFDHAALTWPAAAWTGTNVDGSSGPAAGPATGYTRADGQFTVTGSGDIGPVTYGPSGIGTTPAQTLAGAFIALIILAVTGATFITAEYRRGLIRVTLAACPRRGRVLAAKAVVTGLVAFAVALAGTAVAVPLGQRVLRSHGVYLPPLTVLTEGRMIVGTAAALALCAVLAVAIGTVARRGAAAVAAVIALIAAPYVLTVAIPVAARRGRLADAGHAGGGVRGRADRRPVPASRRRVRACLRLLPAGAVGRLAVLCAWPPSS